MHVLHVLRQVFLQGEGQGLEHPACAADGQRDPGEQDVDGGNEDEQPFSGCQRGRIGEGPGAGQARPATLVVDRDPRAPGRVFR